MKPCKHLDYREGVYEDCEIKTADPHYPNVRYWARGARWTENGTDTPNPRNVQFCGAGRGRINGIFQCYSGEMNCYQPVEPA